MYDELVSVAEPDTSASSTPATVLQHLSAKANVDPAFELASARWEASNLPISASNSPPPISEVAFVSTGRTRAASSESSSVPSYSFPRYLSPPDAGPSSTPLTPAPTATTAELSALLPPVSAPLSTTATLNSLPTLAGSAAPASRLTAFQQPHPQQLPLHQHPIQLHLQFTLPFSHPPSAGGGPFGIPQYSGLSVVDAPSPPQALYTSQHSMAFPIVAARQEDSRFGAAIAPNSSEAAVGGLVAGDGYASWW